jgi:hypothetical protein
LQNDLVSLSEIQSLAEEDIRSKRLFDIVLNFVSVPSWGSTERPLQFRSVLGVETEEVPLVILVQHQASQGMIIEIRYHSHRLSDSTAENLAAHFG